MLADFSGILLVYSSENNYFITLPRSFIFKTKSSCNESSFGSDLIFFSILTKQMTKIMNMKNLQRSSQNGNILAIIKLIK